MPPCFLDFTYVDVIKDYFLTWQREDSTKYTMHNPRRLLHNFKKD